MKYLYLLVDLFTIVIPLAFSFHPKIKFYKTWKEFFIAAIPVAIIFLIWDSIFTRLGIWSFNLNYLVGYYFFNLPVEEVLFFICIPFSCVFTYYCLDKFFKLGWPTLKEKLFCIFFSVALIITGFIFKDKCYTSITFFSTAFVCLFLKLVLRINWFGRAVSVYLILLIPFLIVNGILTGTGLEEPVVRYNHSETLGIRLLTIPVEDIFYGFELLLLNLLIYLQLLRKKEFKKKIRSASEK